MYNNTIIEIDNCSLLELLKFQVNLKKIADGEDIPFVTGKGKKKPDIQQLYEELKRSTKNSCCMRLEET